MRHVPNPQRAHEAISPGIGISLDHAAFEMHGRAPASGAIHDSAVDKMYMMRAKIKKDEEGKIEEVTDDDAKEDKKILHCNW